MSGSHVDIQMLPINHGERGANTLHPESVRLILRCLIRQTNYEPLGNGQQRLLRSYQQ